MGDEIELAIIVSLCNNVSSFVCFNQDGDNFNFSIIFPFVDISVIFYDFLTDYSVFYILYIALLAIVYYIK